MATVSRYTTAKGATLWRVRYRTPDKRQTDKRGFRTKREAQAFAEELEVDKREGAYVAPSAGKVTLGDFAAEWLASKHKLKPSTRARYQTILDTVIADHARIPIGEITRPMVRDWVSDLSVDMAPASVHKAVGVIRQVLAMAIAENRLVVNPADGVELPAAAVEQRFLTLDQLHALAGAAGKHRALVYVLGTCGLRFGEAAELRWRDVQLDARRIRVARSVALVDGDFVIGSPKSGKGRTVSIPALVADLLAASRTSRLDDLDELVFPDSYGNHMRGSNVRRRWWAAAIAAAEIYPRTELDSAGRPVTVYDFKLHELRHTAASLAIQAGAHIKSLQNMLGHASASLTLDRYGHLYESDVEAVGVAVNTLLTSGFPVELASESGQIVGTEPVDCSD
jgi:integrase